MFGGGVTRPGFDSLEARMKMRVRRARDLGWLVGKLVGYFRETRIPKMFQYGGIVPGRYGKGMKRWAPNTSWVARAKGFNKPLFSSPDKSGIEEKYKVYGSAWSRKLEIVIMNYHKAAAWLEQGIAGGFKRIRAKNAEYLKIPIAPGKFIFRKSVRKGSRKGRHIVRTFPGDANKAAKLGAEGIVHPER